MESRYIYFFDIIVLTDPEVTVNVPNIDVPEEQPEVEVCISVNTGFAAQQVVVTIETGPKAGSSNPATGM